MGWVQGKNLSALTILEGLTTLNAKLVHLHALHQVHRAARQAKALRATIDRSREREQRFAQREARR